MAKAEKRSGLSLFEAAQAMGVSFDEKAEPVDRWVNINGMRFHYLDWGNEGKQPLLFLHGGLQTAHSWDFVALSVRPNFHIRALDQRGHGDSDWAPDGDYSREAHRRDIYGFTKALDLKDFVLIGLSMGGMNSIVYTATHPERVKALVIVDVGPEIMVGGVENIRRFATQSDEFDSVEAAAQRVHSWNPRRPIEQLQGSLVHNLKTLPSGKLTWKYDRVMRDPSRRPARGPTDDLWPYVRKIACPTLIIRAGESDVLSDDAAQKLHDAIPGSQLVVVPRAGHLVQGDNPAGFIKAVKGFLKSLSLLG